MPFVDDENDPIAQRLNAMPQLDPPAGLRRNVMNEIRSMVRTRPAAFGAQRRHAFAAGWAIAAAIILVFVMVIGPRDDTAVPATIAPPEVTMDVVKGDGVVRLELSAPRKVTISVHFDPKSAVFGGVSGAEDASFRDNLTTFTLRGRSQRAVVELRPQGDARSTTVVVSADGKEVIRTEVDLNRSMKPTF